MKKKSLALVALLAVAAGASSASAASSRVSPDSDYYAAAMVPIGAIPLERPIKPSKPTPAPAMPVEQTLAILAAFATKIEGVVKYVVAARTNEWRSLSMVRVFTAVPPGGKNENLQLAWTVEIQSMKY